jgi:integrase
MRSIPKGLGKHRSALAGSTAASGAVRERLARMTVAKVTSDDVQALIDAYCEEAREPATVHLERATIRRLFNYSRNRWNWTAPIKNPGTGLDMPKVDNARDRVMSMEEQARLDEAVHGCRNNLVGPMLTLLRETAMRSSEPLTHARWKDLNWGLKILALTDAKAGKRDVPLSPAAIDALKALWELGRKVEGDPIVHITYEALKASWELVCIRAGVDGLRLQDLRHTAATRMALKTGNLFLVQALTGHKTLSQVTRYVNIKAEDVVAVMHAPSPAVETTAAPELVETAAAPPRGQPVSVSLSMKKDGGDGFPQEWALE